jgi:hypothetical protein
VRETFLVVLHILESRDSSVGIALGYGMDGVLGFDSRRGAENFSLHHRVQNGSGAHPAYYPMDTRGSFPGVKRPGREAIPPLPQYVFMVWCLVKHRDNFTFTFTFTFTFNFTFTSLK